MQFDKKRKLASKKTIFWFLTTSKKSHRLLLLHTSVVSGLSVYKLLICFICYIFVCYEWSCRVTYQMSACGCRNLQTIGPGQYIVRYPFLCNLCLITVRQASFCCCFLVLYLVSFPAVFVLLFYLTIRYAFHLSSLPASQNLIALLPFPLRVWSVALSVLSSAPLK
jgi:hypothetical protein